MGGKEGQDAENGRGLSKGDGGHGRLRGQEEQMLGSKTGCSVCVWGD